MNVKDVLMASNLNDTLKCLVDEHAFNDEEKSKICIAYTKMYQNFSSLIPEPEEDVMTLKIDEEDDDEFSKDECLDSVHVYGIYEKDIDEKYAIELSRWENILAFNVDEQQVSYYGENLYMAHLLWEITFFGLDQETIQSVIPEEYSPEDFVKYDSIEEFFESIKKI